MRKAFLLTLAAAVFLAALTLVHAQTIPLEQQEARAVQTDSLPEVQLIADNSQIAPLFVQAASTKEVSKSEYAKLTGERSQHLRHSTFPEVTLQNTSGKTIKSFAIAVRSALDKPNSGYFLIKSDLSITPGAAYKVGGKEWLRADSVSVQKGDKFVRTMRQPGPESPKYWLPGAASDLKVVVGMVLFADGEKWMIPSNTEW